MSPILRITNCSLIKLKVPLAFGRCFYLAKSYSLAGKKTEAYALYCHARSLVDDALHKLDAATNSDEVDIFYEFIDRNFIFLDVTLGTLSVVSFWSFLSV